MVISHKYKFIFVKTKKTAGTSIESYLSPLCDANDIFTSRLRASNSPARNHTGYWNPMAELIRRDWSAREILGELWRGRKYYHHIEAWKIRARTSKTIWNTYYKFAVERNPWDKALSHFHFLNKISGAALSLDEYLNGTDFATNYRQYLEYGSTSKLIVDRVLRYENLNEELGQVLGMLGVPYAGTLDNRDNSGDRTDRRPYGEVFTDAQRARVSEIHSPEIELFDYRF
jgi:hypothetical protein